MRDKHLKTNHEEVAEAFAMCLRQLYAIAGIPIPEAFDPDQESIRIFLAIWRKGLNER